jgi:hypothetical protein
VEGICVLLSTRPVLAPNKSSGNGVAGLYVGGNQEVDAKVHGNTTWDNPIGIFLRDVSHGTLERNRPVDIFGDETGEDVTFRNNRCGTSQPAEVCD